MAQYLQINVIYHIYILKNKNFINILVDAGKAFDKIQHEFIIKPQNEVGIERT